MERKSTIGSLLYGKSKEKIQRQRERKKIKQWVLKARLREIKQ